MARIHLLIAMLAASAGYAFETPPNCRNDYDCPLGTYCSMPGWSRCYPCQLCLPTNRRYDEISSRPPYHVQKCQQDYVQWRIPDLIGHYCALTLYRPYAELRRDRNYSARVQAMWEEATTNYHEGQGLVCKHYEVTVGNNETETTVDWAPPFLYPAEYPATHVSQLHTSYDKLSKFPIGTTYISFVEYSGDNTVYDRCNVTITVNYPATTTTQTKGTMTSPQTETGYTEPSHSYESEGGSSVPTTEPDVRFF